MTSDLRAGVKEDMAVPHIPAERQKEHYMQLKAKKDVSLKACFHPQQLPNT